MDALDKTILEHLEFDGRSSMQDLSELSGLSRSAVFTRLKRMEDQGVIAGYTVRVNRKKLGMEIRAYCNVTLKLHERELLEEFEGHDLECLLTRCLEYNSWSTACSHGLEPSSGAKAPSITRYEPRKIKFRSWCDEIVSCFDCKLKKGLSHDGTNSV